MKKYKNLVEWAKKLGSTATTEAEAKKYIATKLFYPAGYELKTRTTAINARHVEDLIK